SVCTGTFPAQDKAELSGEKVNVFLAQDAIGGLKEQAAGIGTVTFAKPGLKLGDLKGDNIAVLMLANKSVADYLADQKIKVDAKWLGEQGFQIATTKRPDGKLIAITANTDAGLYYGLLKLAGKLSGAKNIGELSVNMKDRPVFELRAGPPEKCGNIVIFDGSEVFDFTMFPECFGGDKDLLEKYKRTTEARRKELRALLDKGRSCGQKIFVHTYEPSILEELRDNFFRAHPEAKSSLYDHATPLCPSAEITKKFVYERYRELFASFPVLAGSVIVHAALPVTEIRTGRRSHPFFMQMQVYDLYRSAELLADEGLLHSGMSPSELAKFPEIAKESEYWYARSLENPLTGEEIRYERSQGNFASRKVGGKTYFCLYDEHGREIRVELPPAPTSQPTSAHE
ncbi:MAG: hypothetical protein SVV80_03980, partial [Planctomycetota bacterium]|nr:hypothetical protein [Planctomycetota bacterium]